MKIRIEREFRDLIPPATGGMRADLTESIKEDGIRAAVTVWKETGILLDGHTRVGIHRELGRHDWDIPVVFRSFKNANFAKVWMIENKSRDMNFSVSQRSMMAAKLMAFSKTSRNAKV